MFGHWLIGEGVGNGERVLLDFLSGPRHESAGAHSGDVT